MLLQDSFSFFFYFLWLNKIPSIFGCFHILVTVKMLQWTWEGSDCFRILISFPSDIFPVVQLLHYVIVPLKNLKGTPIQFSRVAVLIHIPTNSVQGFVLLHLLKHLSSLVILVTVILTHVRWCLLVVLVYIILFYVLRRNIQFSTHEPFGQMISDFQHLFM